MLFFLINTSKGNIACHSILDSVSLRIPSTSNRSYSVFSPLSANFKNSPSTRRASAENAVCRNTDICNKACSLITRIN
jgi:hypothetical protein